MTASTVESDCHAEGVGVADLTRRGGLERVLGAAGTGGGAGRQRPGGRLRAAAASEPRRKSRRASGLVLMPM